MLLCDRLTQGDYLTQVLNSFFHITALELSSPFCVSGRPGVVEGFSYGSQKAGRSARVEASAPGVLTAARDHLPVITVAEA